MPKQSLHLYFYSSAIPRYDRPIHVWAFVRAILVFVFARAILVLEFVFVSTTLVFVLVFTRAILYLPDELGVVADAAAALIARTDRVIYYSFSYS